MATGQNTFYWPDEGGSSYAAAGSLRLKIDEDWDDGTRKSTITLHLQIYSAYRGDWTANGYIKVNGLQVLVNGTGVKNTEQNKWTDCWTGTTEITHDEAGKAKLLLEVVKSAYSRFAIVSPSNQSVYCYLKETSGQEYELQQLDAGSIVYIGGEPYDIVIGNGSSWDSYDAVIGNGSAWENY